MFTYEVNLLCDMCPSTGTQSLVTGDVGESVEEGERSALAEAISEGWLALGLKMVCPKCQNRPVGFREAA